MGAGPVGVLWREVATAETGTDGTPVVDWVPDPLDLDDTLPATAAWLRRHPWWIEQHPAAGELVNEIGDAVDRVRRAVDLPPAHVFCGPCPDCGADAAEIARALPVLLGRELSVNTVRTCARSGKLTRPLVVHTLERLGAIPCPDLPLRVAEQRWSAYIDDPAILDHLRDDALFHIEFNNQHVLINDGKACFVDWAWATRGAAWIDPALWGIWLIATGSHEPAQAETWAARTTAWHTAPTPALNTFADANAKLWREDRGRQPRLMDRPRGRRHQPMGHVPNRR